MAPRPRSARSLSLSPVRALILLAALSAIAGCTERGEFGREAERPLFSSEAPAHTGSVPPSSYPLTEDEQHLRALARNLLAGPAERGRWALVGSDGAGPDAQDREGYVAYLVDGPFRSAAARYSRLIDDTRNDIVRLEPFFTAARRVADLDMKRERSLPHVSQVTQGEAANARRRVRENMMLVAEVHRALFARTVVYRRALERLVIALPSPLAVEAERQRMDLERRLAAIQVFAEGPGAAVAK